MLDLLGSRCRARPRLGSCYLMAHGTEYSASDRLISLRILEVSCINPARETRSTISTQGYKM